MGVSGKGQVRDPSNSLTIDTGEEEKEEPAAKSSFYSYYLKPFTMQSPPDHKKPAKPKANLGVLLGVYLPTIQHIFGVLMFLRLFWIVGSMGIIESFFMVLICCLCTLLTSLSMSAIATNGIVESGGSYFMISRNLGPAIGTSVGILFYFANAVAASMYIVGAVEILLMYLAPEITIPFGIDEKNDTAEYLLQLKEIHLETEIGGRMTHNFRIYGLALLLIVTGLVACGVRVVQFVAPFSLLGVILSILAIYAGAIQKSFDWKETNEYKICVINRAVPNGSPERIVLQRGFWFNNSGEDCGDNLLHHFHDICFEEKCSLERKEQDSFCQSTRSPNCSVTLESGFTGFTSSTFDNNAFNLYMKSEESAPGIKADKERDVFQDTKTNFFFLLAIYFPSVTGILTGANMSGDLKNPQKAIPRGTILAQLTCSFVYLSLVFVFGATIDGVLLRDKFGRSIGNEMVVAMLAWPHKYVVLVGCFTSSFGAALQCLCSAPRVLQSIAKDGVIPFLSVFKKTTRCHGEPIWGLLLSSVIAACFLMVGVLDYVAPIVDFFFLVCYAVINACCAFNSFIKSPSWRPRYRYYNKWLSVLGFFLCLFIMFSTHWYYALGVWAITAFISCYVKWKGIVREWGDGRRGLYLSLAQYALVKLEDKEYHPKNWRPQLLMLLKWNMAEEKRLKMLQLPEQLRAGQGLTLVASVLHGNTEDKELRKEAKKLKMKLQEEMKELGVTGFAQTFIFSKADIGGSMEAMVQCAGIGGLKPNTILVGWPESWKENAKLWDQPKEYLDFFDKIHRGVAFDNCLLVQKGVEFFPSSSEKVDGFIDIWWFIADGGILILLGFLLTKHPTWSSCKLRIFVVTKEKDSTLKNKLKDWLYHLRIESEVIVEDASEEDVEAYSHVRTLQKKEMMKHLKAIPEFFKLPYNIDNRNQSSTTSTSTPSLSVTPEDYQNRRTASEQSAGAELEFEDELLDAAGKKQVASAATLNALITKNSKESALVIVNLPQPPRKRENLLQYLQYVDALTLGISRSILVRGCGKEVITIYN